MEANGSVNFMSAIASGYVVGEPRYANYEPHHQKVNGAWIYVNMYHEDTENSLVEVIENKNRDMKASHVSMVWSEEKGLRLIQFASGFTVEKPLPDGGRNFYVSGEPDLEENGEFMYFDTELTYDDSFNSN